MAIWLVKTEPEVYSIDDLKRDRVTSWDSVRNYQARNFLREMKPGETVIVYHSSTEPPAIAGFAKVKKAAYADPTQFDKKSDYYDPKATADEPRWFCPDLAYVGKLPRPLPLAELRKEPKLAKMMLLQKGSRLSVQPVTECELDAIRKLASA